MRVGRPPVPRWPADSRLLYDGVRVLTRLLDAAREQLGADAVAFHDHRRAVKRRVLELQSQTRGAAPSVMSPNGIQVLYFGSDDVDDA